MRDVRAGGTGAYKVKRAWRVRVEVGCEMVLQKVGNLAFNGRV